jgi:hypothetical protein
MCVAEVQKQLGKVGLEGSPIRIFRNRNERGRIEFSVDIDPMVNDLDIEKIAGVCPALVFTIEEEEENGLTG